MSRKSKTEDVSVSKTRRQLKQEEEENQIRKQVYAYLAGILGLIILVLLVGVVFVFFVQPTQPVATVNGEDISLGEWQDQVRYQRAQLITQIDDFYESLDGNVGFIQQIYGQQLGLLLPRRESREVLGEGILEGMIEDRLIRMEAARRDIVVTEEDINERIGSFFNYFDGNLPTPQPTSTNTPQPTPSITPIPTQVITEVLPTNTPFPTAEPQSTSTPSPTATPVSQESFDDQYAENIANLVELGTTEELYRYSVESLLYRERVTDALAEEQGFTGKAPHVSFFILTFSEEADAQEALQLVNNEDYLNTWNTIRSTPLEPGSPTRSAREVLWRTNSQVVTQFSQAVADEAFTLEINEPSSIITQIVNMEEQTLNYHIIMLSGRESRDLSETQIDTEKQNILQIWIDAQRQTVVEVYDNWRNSIPVDPSLDEKFIATLTPAPTQALPPIDTDSPIDSESSGNSETGENNGE